MGEHKRDRKRAGDDTFSLVVKLGTISQYGADVFDYARGVMVMEALFIDENDADSVKMKTKNCKGNALGMCLEELRPLMMHWGIEMGSMYKYDKSMQEVDLELNQTFSGYF